MLQTTAAQQGSIRAAQLTGTGQSSLIRAAESQMGPGMMRGMGQGRMQGFGHGRLGPGRVQGMDGCGEFGCYGPVFHSLLNNHQQIQRQVTKTDSGVISTTTSQNPEVAKLIQLHVRQMHALMAGCAKKQCPAQPRWWDPVFAAVYSNADKINMQVSNTDGGVKVVESGSTDYAGKLIQAHADVVSAFVQNGMSELKRPHTAPK